MKGKSKTEGSGADNMALLLLDFVKVKGLALEYPSEGSAGMSTMGTGKGTHITYLSPSETLVFY